MSLRVRDWVDQPFYQVLPRLEQHYRGVDIQQVIRDLNTVRWKNFKVIFALNRESTRILEPVAKELDAALKKAARELKGKRGAAREAQEEISLLEIGASDSSSYGGANRVSNVASLVSNATQKKGSSLCCFCICAAD